MKNSEERDSIPYRTLRWECMIRLASSGVRSSMLGLSFRSVMMMGAGGDPMYVPRILCRE